MEKLFGSTLTMTNREEKWITRSSSASLIIYGVKAKSTEENRKKEENLFIPWLKRSWSMPSETDMRLLLHKKKRDTAAPGVLPLPTHVIVSVKKLLVTPHGDSCYKGESSSKIKTSPTVIKQHDLKKSSESPTYEKISPAKRLKTKKNQSSCVNRDNNKNNNSDDAMELLRKIPKVSTRGDGPSEKRIERILYKYSRGQVCIVCVCHGRFFSPSEFVMHAGGNQVDNPMKHITVSSNNSF